jgi:carboxypeptidase PM20D1
MRPLIQGLGREAPFLLQMKFANLWLFGGLERRKLLASPKMAASIRTTTAVTMINGGVKDNILPPQATAIVNFRLLPGDSVADVCNHIRRMVDDERVVLTTLPGAHPAPEPSDTDSPAYRSLEKTIRQVFNNPPVTPYLMLGATDSRHFCGLSRNVYRFEPLLMTNTDLDMIHGVDERVSVEGLGRMVQFFQLLIQRWTSKMVSTDPGL